MRAFHFPPFLRIYLAGTAVLQIPFAVAMHEVALLAGLSAPAAWGLGAWLLGTLLFVFASRTWIEDFAPHPLVHRAVDLPYWIHWSACLLCLGFTGMLGMGVFGWSLWSGEPVGWTVFSRGVLLSYFIGLGLSLYGTLLGRRRLVLTRMEIPIHGLPMAFDGYRIAHWSDLHLGSMTPPALAEEWARLTNGCSPDLAVVSGDLVSSGGNFVEDTAIALGRLRARDGTFVSLGNHDYFGPVEELVRALRAERTRVLRNEGTVLERGGARLYLAAVDDTWSRRANLDAALAKRPTGVVTILLAHDPQVFRGAVKHGVALTLSGHTHGGQISLRPLVPRRPLHLGLYHQGVAALFVHPGMGTTGPPIRLGVPPAIALLTLRAV